MPSLLTRGTCDTKSAGWWESLKIVPTLSQKSFVWPLGSLSCMPSSRWPVSKIGIVEKNFQVTVCKSKTYEHKSLELGMKRVSLFMKCW